MIDREHDLPIKRQAEVLSISRGSVYYQPRPMPENDLLLMRKMDELHLNYPFAGRRMLRDLLRQRGFDAGRLHIGSQVWAMDISYIPMARGFVYLAAVVDWFSRRILSWRLSIAMDVSFCLEAVDEALAKHGSPEIFNTDQGSQFSSEAFTGRLKENNIAISMDGKGSWRDNVFIERIWRSIKYEEVYLHAYPSVQEARTSLRRYIEFYNAVRPHSRLKGNTPDQAYFHRPPETLAA